MHLVPFRVKMLIMKCAQDVQTPPILEFNFFLWFQRPANSRMFFFLHFSGLFYSCCSVQGPSLQYAWSRTQEIPLMRKTPQYRYPVFTSADYFLILPCSIHLERSLVNSLIYVRVQITFFTGNIYKKRLLIQCWSLIWNVRPTVSLAYLYGKIFHIIHAYISLPGLGFLRSLVMRKNDSFSNYNCLTHTRHSINLWLNYVLKRLVLSLPPLSC